jgi:hypothetical protein
MSKARAVRPFVALAITATALRACASRKPQFSRASGSLPEVVVDSASSSRAANVGFVATPVRRRLFTFSGVPAKVPASFGSADSNPQLRKTVRARPVGRRFYWTDFETRQVTCRERN